MSEETKEKSNKAETKTNEIIGGIGTICTLIGFGWLGYNVFIAGNSFQPRDLTSAVIQAAIDSPTAREALEKQGVKFKLTKTSGDKASILSLVGVELPKEEPGLNR